MGDRMRLLTSHKVDLGSEDDIARLYEKIQSTWSTGTSHSGFERRL
jgi:hypothetical protein